MMGGDGAPLFRPCLQALDDVVVVVDSVRGGDLRLVTARRDCLAAADVPDVLAEAVPGVASIDHHSPGTLGNVSSNGTAWGSSYAWPGVRRKTIAQPLSSAITLAGC